MKKTIKGQYKKMMIWNDRKLHANLNAKHAIKKTKKKI